MRESGPASRASARIDTLENLTLRGCDSQATAPFRQTFAGSLKEGGQPLSPRDYTVVRCKEAWSGVSTKHLQRGKNCAIANPHTVSKVRSQKKAPRDLSRFSIESEFSPSDALSYPLEKKQNNKRRQQDERRSPPFELLLITVDRSADPEIFRCQPRPARQDRARGAVAGLLLAGREPLALCPSSASGTSFLSVRRWIFESQRQIFLYGSAFGCINGKTSTLLSGSSRLQSRCSCSPDSEIRIL